MSFTLIVYPLPVTTVCQQPTRTDLWFRVVK